PLRPGLSGRLDAPAHLSARPRPLHDGAPECRRSQEPEPGSHPDDVGAGGDGGGRGEAGPLSGDPGGHRDWPPARHGAGGLMPGGQHTHRETVEALEAQARAQEADENWVGLVETLAQLATILGGGRDEARARSALEQAYRVAGTIADEPGMA